MGGRRGYVAHAARNFPASHPLADQRRVPVVVVTRTYLRLSARAAFRPARVSDSRLRLALLESCSAERYRELYRAVGERHQWRDRLAWSDAELEAHLARPTTQLWLLTRDGADAGYFELALAQAMRTPADGGGIAAPSDPGTDVEIAYFGLVPAFLGRGLGGHLLTCAVEAGWAAGGERVWLHTCSLDGPAALPNYRARGFEPYAVEEYSALLPGDDT